MPLATGTKLGPYEINSALGAGGMGEVYLAQDTRLGRRVAIKILLDKFARDAQRMARFDREAKVLASLNHPNIASIYGLEESNSARALVMELVEGPTLADRIQQGTIPIDEALQIARQIAEALEYAHERGIIHRDLKPSNVKVTPNGVAKVLDYGLAKALEDNSSVSDISTSPTLSQAATQAGILLGTAAYMSPEQARGKKVDCRADIWSFGIVLYEMLTGKPAFLGETISDTLAAVIRAEPDWSVLPGNLPTSVVRLLRRCLTKDPKQRLRDIGEARIAIEGVIAGTPDETVALAEATTEPQPRWRRTLPWAVASMAIAFALAVGVLHWRGNQPAPHQVMQVSLLLPEPIAGVFSANPGSPIALSRDGSRLVFVGSPSGKPSQLYLRPLDQQTATPIPSTENAVQPFFSPEGQWIGFFADGKMRKVSLSGGPATTLCEAPVPHGANWVGDDTIIYAPNFGSGLMRIPSSGGSPQTLTTPNIKEQEISHRWPQVLPGGKAVLFTIQMTTQTSYDDARISVLSLETSKWRTLLDGGFYARYVPSGHIVYGRAGTLMAVPFDVARLQLVGAPTPVQEGVVTTFGTSGGAEYDVTPSGLLAYVPGKSRPPERFLVWVDRQGVSKELPAPPNIYSAPRISPDGKLLAVQITSSSRPDIWIYEFARNTLTRLTFGPSANSTPVWTPDGRRVLYRSIMASASFRWKMADGSGKEEVVLSEDLDDPAAFPGSLSPNGKTLLFGTRNSTGTIGIQALSLDGDGKVQPFLQSAFNQMNAEFSPDGHWVAYMSNESGRNEIYVQPFPGPGGKWMISTDGGFYPRWARDSREIFFRNEDKMMSVAVETQPGFKAGTPRVLFKNAGYLAFGNYDVAKDSQHFLLVKEKETAASPKELNIILNWSEELKRHAPAGKK
jgi:serine/threonine-protein kinase